MSLAVREFSVAGVDFEKLAKDVEGFFRDDGYKTQVAQSNAGYVVQATKETLLRGVLAADRAFTIAIGGDAQKVRVSIGVGKWLQNFAVEVIEGIIVSPLLFLLEIPISLWSYEIELDLWRFVERQLQGGSVNQTIGSA